MYVTRYAWEMGGAVVVATQVNKNNLLLQTRVHTILLQEEEEKLKL